MNSYDEVKLEVVRTLNSSVLNNAFTKLYKNDIELAPSYDYTPNIWECKWYNDDVIPGYSRGHCVWKNAYVDLSSFLNDYGDVVFEYAQSNDMLKDIITTKWQDAMKLSSVPQRNMWIQNYMNVVSGYSKQTTTSLTMNDKVRYVKIAFRKDVKLDNVKLHGLCFYKADDEDNMFSHRNAYFSVNGFTKCESIVNILDSHNDAVISTTGEEESSITIDFGRKSLLFKIYNKLSICISTQIAANAMTVYASEDGEDFAQIVASSQLIKPAGAKYDARVVIQNIAKHIQYMDPLFEYGPLVISADPRNAKPRIELYVSTTDDNKEMLSNRTAWNQIVLSSQTAYEEFVKTEVDMLFADHIKRYHFDGILSNAAEVNAILLNRDMSNFEISSVPTQLRVTDHDAFINSDGFDYVAKFNMQHYAVDDSSDMWCHHLFRWYRLWNSGYLEHGGTIQCQPVSSASSPEDYYISVDLTWNGDSTVPVYNYDETSSANDGTVYTDYYYGNPHQKESINPSEMLLRGNRYTVSITPVQFEYDRDIKNGKYLPLSSLSSNSYPEKPLGNKVSSYITTEVHHIKNGSFCFTKSNTDNLMSNNIMQLYTYHTTGFVKRGDSK